MLRLPIYPITLSTYILVTDSWNKTFGMLWNLFSSENFITSQLHHFFEYRTLVGLIKISGENGGQKRKSLARNGRDEASLMSFIIKKVITCPILVKYMMSASSGPAGMNFKQVSSCSCFNDCFMMEIILLPGKLEK